MISSIVFAAFGGLYFVLGLNTFTVEKRVWSTRVFLASLAVLPFSGLFSLYWYRVGIACFDFFWIGFAIVFLARLLAGAVEWRNLVLPGIIVFLTAIHVLLTAERVIDSRWSDVLKDLKPLVTICLVSVLISREVATRVVSDDRWLEWTLQLTFLKSAVFFVLVRFFGLAAIASDDPFFANDPDTQQRYIDFAPIFALIYALWALTRTRNLTWLELLMILSIVYLSGSRTFLAIVLLVLLLPALRSGRVLVSSFLAAMVIAGLVLLSERIAAGLAPEVVARDLVVRYSPFLVAIRDFSSWTDIFLGLGVGYAFNIPWFDYRASVDPWNNFLDNAYLTLFVKYGLSSGLLIIVLVVTALSRESCRKVARPMLVALLLLGFTNSIFYQQSFALLAVWWCIVLRANWPNVRLEMQGSEERLARVAKEGP